MTRTERRVRVFVILAIAVFVAAGFAANRYVTSAHSPAPAAPTPASDTVVAPDPQGSAVPARTPAPKTTSHRPVHRPPATRPKPKSHSPAPPVRPAAPATSSKGMSAEDAAVRLTNAQRTQHGCTALRLDPRLRTAARRHSADMHDRHYFAHDSLDGTTPWDRIRAAGYTSPGAENIAQGYPSAQAVLQGWMNSPGHRANILNCGLKAVGIGVEYGQGGPWWTQDFGYR